MKHLILTLFLLINVCLWANVSTNYIFTQPTSNYTAISGGIVLGDANSDDELYITNTSGSASSQIAPGFSIGFTFSYNGTTYTQFGVSNNGYIKLGNLPTFSMSSNGYYQDMPSTGDNTLISSCTNDLQGQTGSELSYITQGSSPNRTLTVQWKKYRLYGESSGEINFQIILYETSNVIELSYGTFTYGTGQSGWETTSMVGLYGITNSDYFLRTQSTDWNTTINGASNGASISYNGTCLPSNNLLFRYTPISALPIELLSFDGYSKYNMNNLNWKVASQTNNEKFILEKSNDTKAWEIIATIAGAGTVSKEMEYTFTDKSPYLTTYYKLTQIDFDGKSQSFNIIAITNSSLSGVLSIKPNPFHGALIIEIGFGINQTYELKIINMEGEIMLTKILEGDSGILTYYMDVVWMPSGSYSVIITTFNSTYSKIFIKD